MAKLTDRLVRAAEARMRAACGSLSLRQALLHDRDAGVTDRDLAAWLERGETLDIRGAHADDQGLGDHDRLCLTLVRLDRDRSGRALLLAGEAKERLLLSRDPKLAGAQVNLIKHVETTLGEASMPASRQPAPSRGVLDIPQADVDLMTDEEARELERLVRVHTEAGAAIRALAERVRSRRAAGPSDGVVH